MSREADLKKRQAQVDADFRFIVSRPEGQRFMAALMNDCGLYSTVTMDRRSYAVGLRDRVIKHDARCWIAIETAMIAQRIEAPKPAPEEIEDE